MGWQVFLSSYAREAYRGLDGRLQEELREHVDHLTENPLPSFRRPVPPEPPDLLVFEYRSLVDAAVRVLLYFEPPSDLEPRQLELLAIVLRSDPTAGE